MKKYIIIVLIALTSLNSAFAQAQFNLRDRAQKFYNEYKYYQAAALFQKLVDVKNPKLEDLEGLADCYVKLKDYEAAENWYARVIATSGSKPENLMLYGETLKNNLKYDAAKKVLQQYATTTGNKAAVEVELAGCDSALLWIANPTIHQIKNESLINTPLANFSIFPYQNGVFFTGEPAPNGYKDLYDRTGHPYLRIFTAAKGDQNALSNPRVDSMLYNKGEYHIGPVSTNKSGSVLYVTRTTTGKILEVVKAGKYKYSTANLELYLYKNSNGKWVEAAFPYNNVEKYSVGHAALSKDEQTLYFISDMPGGLGGTDIWYCELQADQSWGTPQNAGPDINTVKDEMFPNVDEDGTLYFSSTGWPGMGGLDIFSTKGSKQSWTKPQNLKFPLNSPGDDFAFLTLINKGNIATGYLSSNRKGGAGNDDIYSFTYNYIAPKVVLALNGNIGNKKTGEIIPGATVTLYNEGHQVVARQSSTGQGTFMFDLEPGKTYQLVGQKEKFYADSATIVTTGINKSQVLNAKLQLEPLFEIGKTIAIQNIHYNFDKDNIRPDAAKILDELVRTMRDNPTLEIELGSHTDSRGIDIYNIDLSQRRARSVVNYLVTRGIARERMTAKGYGETQLLNKCSNGVSCTVAEHQANRRTEFKIIKY
ncbi:OmpA family protein [Pedobacter polaris]|uniref:OmpA family protein n=1 Tax=Pedobacter polaris TaxID=2571273 RepID=A0A4U1CS33_9SPHI|nr:OmpA family protein [Pedobacter polaris]TKC10544.1 OmpA family protein [Pedobacter polaris]